MDKGLYNLEKLLKSESVKIVIPKIQRAYAQGRIDESQVRKAILEEIFSSLINQEPLEFGFIYGAFNNDSDITKYKNFELLDGQQRLTTLFLVHLFIFIQETKMLPDWMKNRFTYETRTSSGDFIKKICELTFIGDAKTKPSEVIKHKLWYTMAFKLDSTVQAMLIMLDAIHDKYFESDSVETKLADNLEYLQFYILPLNEFGLTEELYIKMNARGLPLTPFENFKADLVGYYEPENKQNEELLKDWIDFSTNLDNKWLDIFWKKIGKGEIDDDKVNEKFFMFFYRFCTNLVYLEKDKTLEAKSFAKNSAKLFNFFESDSENQPIKKKYAGFYGYKLLIESGIDLKNNITKILNTLSDHFDEIITNGLVSNWGDICDFFTDFKNYTRRDAVIFASVCGFILNYDEFDIVNFKKWMRVVWNITENTTIDSVVPQVTTARKLVNDILQKDKLNKNIYKTLSESFLEKQPQAVMEEARKAVLIQNNSKFEDLFISLEKHDFFKGFIDPVISQTSYDIISTRIDRIKEFFDKSGISQSFKQDHIFIRAAISCIRQWEGGLKGMSINEKVDSDNHLKILLRKNEVKNMVQKILDTPEDLKIQLNNVIDDNNKKNFDYNYINKDYMNKALYHLYYDVTLYDWIYNHCEGNHCVIIKELNGRIKVRVPRSWYDKIYIDNSYSKIIPDFLEKHSDFNYVDDNQHKFFSKYKLYFDDAITTQQILGKYIIIISFNYTENVTFVIKYSDIEDSKIIRNIENVKFDDKNFTATIKTSYSLDNYEDALSNIIEILKK